MYLQNVLFPLPRSVIVYNGSDVFWTIFCIYLDEVQQCTQPEGVSSNSSHSANY